MPIRHARLGDIAEISAIYAESFYDESLNAAVCPYRHEYPIDYLRSWKHRVSEAWWDYKRISVVTYEIEQGREKLTGVAEWAREGDGWEQLWGIKGWWDPRLLVRPILRTYHRIHRFIFGNRAAAYSTSSEPCPLTKWTWEAATVPFIAKYLIPPSSRKGSMEPNLSPKHDNCHATDLPKPSFDPPFWELCTLGVLPKQHGLGYGRKLTAWGLNRAQKENLPAVVIAAEGKEQFYKYCGFTNLVGYANEGEENPIQKMGVKGGAILWTERTFSADEGDTADIGKGLRN